MNLFLEILVVILFMIVFVQDLKFRAIHILLPILIMAIGLILFFDQNKEVSLLGYSSIFLLITFVGLYLYLGIKKRNFTNPFKEMMGLGDVLFFIAVIPFFSSHNYILFFITGLLFSIISFFILTLITRTKTVPLAGLLALYLILLKGLNYFNDVDLFFNKIL